MDQTPDTPSSISDDQLPATEIQLADTIPQSVTSNTTDPHSPQQLIQEDPLDIYLSTSPSNSPYIEPSDEVDVLQPDAKFTTSDTNTNVTDEDTDLWATLIEESTYGEGDNRFFYGHLDDEKGEDVTEDEAIKLEPPVDSPSSWNVHQVQDFSAMNPSNIDLTIPSLQVASPGNYSYTPLQSADALNPLELQHRLYADSFNENWLDFNPTSDNLPFEEKGEETKAPYDEVSPFEEKGEETKAPYDEASPLHTIQFNGQETGLPFQLSKAILRTDGMLLVGTEQLSTLDIPARNRIFLHNIYDTTNENNPAYNFIPISAEVRDIQWLQYDIAIVAIGSNIHLLHVPADIVDESLELRDVHACQLHPPIQNVHIDAIRELGLPNHNMLPRLVLSGGFDTTVVLSDFNGQNAMTIARYQATDVVSSVKWSPLPNQFSWTTDSGTFHLTDHRTREVQLDFSMHDPNLGGLFTHTYLDDSNIVLGFENGEVILIDIRLVRTNTSYYRTSSPLLAVGELLHSNQVHPRQLDMFGLGGSASAFVDISNHRLRNSKLPYKTSGDYSFDDRFLVVSDHDGIVSVYNSVQQEV